VNEEADLDLAAGSWLIRRGWILLLVLITCLGAFLRLHGLGGGVWPFVTPEARESWCAKWVRGENKWQGFHPDEVRISMALDELSLKDPKKWDPKFFAYGSLPLYAYKAIYTVWMERMMSEAAAKAGSDKQHIRLPGAYERGYVSGRLLTWALGSLTIPLLFFMGRSWFGWREGLIGASLLSLCVFHIQASHFVAVDVILQFFMTCCIFFCGLLIKTGKIRYYLPAGLFLGASLASKFNAVYLFPLFGTAHLLSLWRKGELLKRKSWRSWTMGAVGCLLAVGVFRLGMPYAFIGTRDPLPARLTKKVEESRVLGMATKVFNPQFLSHIMEENDKARNLNRRPVPYMIQYERTPSYLYQARNWCGVAMGPMLGWGAILGCFLLLLNKQSRRNPMTWFFWFWILVYFGSTGRFHAKFLRHSLPIYGHLCLGAGFLVVWLMDHIQVKWPFPRGRLPVAAAVACAFILPTLWYALAFVSIYSRAHTRMEARDWMNQALKSPDVRLVLETRMWDPLALPSAFVGRSSPRKRHLELYIEDNQKKIQQMIDALDWGNWLIIGTKRQMGSLTRVPERYPFTTLFYKLLYSGKLGYELAACFRSYPSFMGLTYRDDLGDESFAVYDHPKVSLFCKTKEVSPEEMRQLLENTPGEVLSMKMEDLLLAPDLDWSPPAHWVPPQKEKAERIEPKQEPTPKEAREPLSLFKARQGKGPGWLNEARDLAVSDAGEIYVADFRNDRVQVFGLDGTFRRQWGRHGTGQGQFHDLSSLIVHSSGQVYVTDTFNHRVQVFDQQGKYLDVLKTAGTENFFAPTGIAEGVDGQIYVVSTGNRFVYRFDKKGKFLSKWGGKGKDPGQFDRPVGCAVDPQGRVLVADAYNFRIQWFGQDGTYLKEAPVSCWRGEGHLEPYLDLDDQGRIWATDSRNGLVLALSQDGQVLTRLGEGQFIMPVGIAVSKTEIMVLDARKHRGFRFPLKAD